jgi:hypothetical protein
MNFESGEAEARIGATKSRFTHPASYHFGESSFRTKTLSFMA